VRVLFVDDSGNRHNSEREPYFCLGAFSVGDEHLKQVGHRLAAIKKQWRLEAMPLDEIKFNQIGRDHDTKKRPNPLVRVGWDRPARIEFGHAMLRSLAAVPGVKVFMVGIDRRQLGPYEGAMDWAFRLLLERFEFSLNNERPRVGLVICDQEDVQDEAMRRAIYAGSEWTDLPNIAETVMFVPSHHSPGIQFADFVAGSAGRWWNYRDEKYVANLTSVLQTTSKGSWRGAGMKSFRSSDYPSLQG